MRTTVSLITSADELTRLENDLTIFLNDYNTNPFLLYPFIKHIMLKTPTGSNPLILIIKKDEEIIGLAPLVLRQRFGFRRVSSLLKHTGSPDIVAKEEYRKEVLKNVLIVLLKIMKCKSVILTLPEESQNLKALENECKSNGITFSKSTEQDMNHCVIPVNCSWNEFQKSLNTKYRRKLKQAERNLGSIGEWKITSMETTKDDQTANETLNKIRAIEKMSWKEDWRLQTGSTIDQDLEGTWKTSRLLTKTNPDFKTMIWMLELENEPVAYTLVLCHKSEALMVKTSYALKFAKASPGIYLNNAVIADLFNMRGVKKIDFLTDLPFMKMWHPTSFSRVKFKIVPRGDLIALFYDAGNSRIRKFSRISFLFTFLR